MIISRKWNTSLSYHLLDLILFRYSAISESSRSIPPHPYSGDLGDHPSLEIPPVNLRDFLMASHLFSIMVSATWDTRQAMFQNMRVPGKPNNDMYTIIPRNCSNSFVVRLRGLFALHCTVYRFDCPTITSRMSSEKTCMKYWKGDMISSDLESRPCHSG